MVLLVEGVGKKDEIQQEILSLRNSLYELSREVDSLSHPDLVKLSQMLDQKLNQLGRVI